MCDVIWHLDFHRLRDTRSGGDLNEGRSPEYFSERWSQPVEDGGKSKTLVLDSCSGCGIVVSSSRTRAEAARALTTT